MEKRALLDYVNEHGQTTTAKRAGLSQGAIWQMLQSDRQIFVVDHGETVELEEVRQIKGASAA